MKPNIFKSIISTPTRSVNILGERCALPAVQFEPFTASTPEEMAREFERRRRIHDEAVRQAAMQKAERDKQKLYEQLSEQAIFSLTYVPFVIAEVAWDYADTVLDMAAIIRDRRTKRLGYAVKELRRDYDRKRYKIINDKWRDSETENMIMFQETLSDFFGKVYRTYCDELQKTYGKIEDNTLALIGSVYVCKTVLKSVFMFSSAHEKCVARILGYAIDTILPDELRKLDKLIIEYVGDMPLPADKFNELQKQYATELAEYIDDVELDDSDKSQKNNSSKKQQFTMEQLKQLQSDINAKIAEFQQNVQLNIEKGNKAAGVRARKASLELEKMLKTYRKASLDVSK